MQDAEYAIRKMLLRHEIPVTETDHEFQILSCNESLFRAKEFFSDHADVWETLINKSKSQRMPVLYLEQGSWAYAVIRDEKQGRNYVLGPVALGEISRREIWSYRNISKYFVDRVFLQGMDYEKFEGEIYLLFLAITHLQMDEEQFLEENGIEKSEWRVGENEKLMYQIQSSDKGRSYSAYQLEQMWLNTVKQGKKGCELGDEFLKRLDANIVGQMAKNSLKQMEYSCVCMVTLLTRAAIEAGVSAMEAYNLSDMYLQKLEKCGNQMEIATLTGKANEDFLDCIRRAKETMGIPNYILACKDYIAQHRTKNIRVSELAEIVGVSHSYLTKKFKEIEGITIQQYMIKEKIEAAANMMKYSNNSLAEIAEYLNFSSQSHMGQYFRKEYGMTPQEYRRRNKIEEFSEGKQEEKKEKIE